MRCQPGPLDRRLVQCSGMDMDVDDCCRRRSGHVMQTAMDADRCAPSPASAHVCERGEVRCRPRRSSVCANPGPADVGLCLCLSDAERVQQRDGAAWRSGAAGGWVSRQAGRPMRSVECCGVCVCVRVCPVCSICTQRTAAGWCVHYISIICQPSLVAAVQPALWRRVCVRWRNRRKQCKKWWWRGS